jgi:hypothetical protein
MLFVGRYETVRATLHQPGSTGSIVGQLVVCSPPNTYQDGRANGWPANVFANSEATGGPAIAHLCVSVTAKGSIMNTRKVLTILAVIALVIGLPFVILHLAAAPDDAPIKPLQHVVAAWGNSRLLSHNRF